MLQATLQTKILLALLAIAVAFAAFETRQAMQARARAEAVERERDRFWREVEQKRKEPTAWGHAAESFSGFQLRNAPQKKGGK